MTETEPLPPLTYQNLPKFLGQLYSLPHNEVLWADRNSSAEEEVKKTMASLETAAEPGTWKSATLAGPLKLYRAAGLTWNGYQNKAYGGEWWFTQEDLEWAERRASRVDPRGFASLRRELLRETTAVKSSWNSMTEIWELRIPAGETVRALSSRAKRQQRDSGVEGWLSGGSKQYFIPVKNPLWVYQYA